MDDEARRLRRLQRLAQRLRDADAKADAIRAEFRDELKDANSAGVSISAISRELGVSRQRVQQLLGRKK